MVIYSKFWDLQEEESGGHGLSSWRSTRSAHVSLFGTKKTRCKGGGKLVREGGKAQRSVFKHRLSTKRRRRTLKKFEEMNEEVVEEDLKTTGRDKSLS